MEISYSLYKREGCYLFLYVEGTDELFHANSVLSIFADKTYSFLSVEEEEYSILNDVFVEIKFIDGRMPKYIGGIIQEYKAQIGIKDTNYLTQ